ncbi:hypothetical protein [Olleya marilimosa]|uniref:hypothetical protein n=1 Tax=Olleya marilimosa TaxID=272164 RepID=UPI0030ED91F5
MSKNKGIQINFPSISWSWWQITFSIAIIILAFRFDGETVISILKMFKDLFS